ncbi:MAG: FAD-dependent oxidoreductase [Calditrichia bacterium]
MESEDFELTQPDFPEFQNRQVQKIIIIGNGAAGVEAARTIREMDSSAEILLFTDEAYHFYSRIHQPALISGEIGEKEIFIYPASWFEERNIRVFLQTPIEHIFPEEKAIMDDRGERHFYDKLILAMGARPFIPPIPGITLPGVFTLRNLKDAFQIRTCIGECKNAVVIGGGILGIEMASSFQKRGLSVVVVEQAEHIMPAQLDPAGAGVLQQVLEKRGIQFFTRTPVSEIRGNDRVQEVVLANRKRITAQIVLIAAGIIPNVGLASRAGIAVKRGILVNEKLQTNFPDIYAAGDVAEFRGNVFGIWPAAVDQGIIAGQNALDSDARYQGTLPLHILKVADVDVTTLGNKVVENRNEKEIVHLSREDNYYVKLIHDGQTLLGAIVVGVKALGFRLEKLIKKRQNITDILPGLEKADWDVLKK